MVVPAGWWLEKWGMMVNRYNASDRRNKSFIVIVQDLLHCVVKMTDISIVYIAKSLRVYFKCFHHRK
jgi:hypothetical protein